MKRAEKALSSATEVSGKAKQALGKAKQALGEAEELASAAKKSFKNSAKASKNLVKLVEKNNKRFGELSELVGTQGKRIQTLSTRLKSTRPLKGLARTGFRNAGRDVLGNSASAAAFKFLGIGKTANRSDKIAAALRGIKTATTTAVKAYVGGAPPKYPGVNG